MASLSVVQSAGSRVYARARADPAVALREESPDAAWMALADDFNKASAAIPAAARQNLTLHAWPSNCSFDRCNRAVHKAVTRAAPNVWATTAGAGMHKEGKH